MDQDMIFRDDSNMKDGVIIHAIDAGKDGINNDDKRFSKRRQINGKYMRFDQVYAIFICGSVSLPQDSMVHGPACFGNNTMVGVKSSVLVKIRW